MKLMNRVVNAGSGTILRHLTSFAASAIAAAMAMPLLAQSYYLTWVNPQPSASPAARLCMGMAYDGATHSTVLFGGGNGTGTPYLTYGDTWIWRDGLWSQSFPATSPSPRQGPGMAYDAATGTVVLFGGVDTSGTNLNDTWTWDGVTWTQQFPAISPPGRQFDTQGMTYDAATQTVIFFGGLESNDDVLGDTWTWDGPAKTWTQQFPTSSPSSRRTTIAYDAVNKTVVLFGGDIRNGDNGLGIYLNDTWTWDGVDWTQQFPVASPSARGTASMTYDASLRQVLLFGGSALYATEQGLNDTWTWDGNNWTERNPVARPPARWAAGMDFNATGKSVLLVGGEGNNDVFLNDTWLLVLRGGTRAV
ncbi:MAG: kelch repeat-containing protein [Bryobacteraceae bacterium]